MNEQARSLSSIILAVCTGLAAVPLYIGWGIDNLGLRATSPLIRVVRRGLFPWFAYLFPVLLVVSLTYAIMRLRRDKIAGENPRMSIASVAINILTGLHWLFLLLFARVLRSFL